MQVGDTVKEVNGELLDDKTPSEGVWVGVESDWVSVWRCEAVGMLLPILSLPIHPYHYYPYPFILARPAWPPLRVACIGLEQCICGGGGWGWEGSGAVML